MCWYDVYQVETEPDFITYFVLIWSYDNSRKTIRRTNYKNQHERENVIILGDFNAKIEIEKGSCSQKEIRNSALLQEFTK
jgi:metallophosphoesterase superfamily enzyme